MITVLREARQAAGDARSRGQPALDAGLLKGLRERYDDAVAFGIIHNRLRDWDGDIDFRPRPARRKPILTLTPSCRLSSPLPWA